LVFRDVGRYMGKAQVKKGARDLECRAGAEVRHAGKPVPTGDPDEPETGSKAISRG
jgi:hypothetical protein